MQFGLLALATYVGMSRISDYMHHPGDVVTGALLGTISGNSFIFFREINGSLKKIIRNLNFRSIYKNFL